MNRCLLFLVASCNSHQVTWVLAALLGPAGDSVLSSFTSSVVCYMSCRQTSAQQRLFMRSSHLHFLHPFQRWAVYQGKQLGFLMLFLTFDEIWVHFPCPVLVVSLMWVHLFQTFLTPLPNSSDLQHSQHQLVFLPVSFCISKDNVNISWIFQPQSDPSVARGAEGPQLCATYWDECQECNHTPSEGPRICSCSKFSHLMRSNASKVHRVSPQN